MPTRRALAVLERGAGLPARQSPPPYETWDEALDAWNIPQENRNDASASVDPDGQGPRLWFQKVPEGKPPRTASTSTSAPPSASEGDERMAALEAKCEACLLALGATPRTAARARRVVNAGHIVMQDPEGNEFCLD